MSQQVLDGPIGQCNPIGLWWVWVRWSKTTISWLIWLTLRTIKTSQYLKNQNNCFSANNFSFFFITSPETNNQPCQGNYGWRYLVQTYHGTNGLLQKPNKKIFGFLYQNNCFSANNFHHEFTHGINEISMMSNIVMFMVDIKVHNQATTIIQITHLEKLE